ncbi:MAG: hypothetical protein QG580_291 [Patescibacteria group bacterium]|jgi:hypothetical protein|nr:hypothetical protein [Patescibacteria group bacterium]
MDYKNLAKILIAFSALFLPFWVTSIIFVFCVLFFDKFYFGIFVFFFIEIIFGAENYNILNFPGAIFFSSVAVYFLINFLKKFINVRKNESF